MGGWMAALADKVHKQGEHIPQHCYISHNHILTQWSRNDIHIGGAKRSVVNYFNDFGVKSHKIIY